jgi:hypothetical protein
LKLGTVQEAIAAAERLLPGEAGPEDDLDPRWQAIIAVQEFLETDPDDIWPFILKWGASDVEDVRMAISTCLLEHLLEHHFEKFFPKVQAMVQASVLFADMFESCRKFGQTEEPSNAIRSTT